MKIADIEAYSEHLGEPIKLFDSPNYDSALLGVTTTGRAVYDYDLMVKWLESNCDMEEDVAIEFLEYNTIRAAEYQDNGPIIIHTEYNG